MRDASAMRDVHKLILRRIEKSLNGRSWSWLSEASGVPHSTLSAQKGRPKFSVEVLVAVAHALALSVTDLMAGPDPDPGAHKDLHDLLNRLELLIRETRIELRDQRQAASRFQDSTS